MYNFIGESMVTNDEKVNFEINEIDEIGGEGYALAKKCLSKRI